MSAVADHLFNASPDARYRANDVHSKLNPSTLTARIDARSDEEVSAAIRNAGARALPLASCGGQHAA